MPLDSTSLPAAHSECITTTARPGSSTASRTPWRSHTDIAPVSMPWAESAGSHCCIVGRQQNDVACATTWTPGSRAVPQPASDDYPFPVSLTRSLPPLYLVTLAAILLVSFLLIRVAAGPISEMRGYADLFFMGAAFMLLEQKRVQFALLFGSIWWFVNAIVFFGILVAVFAAVEVARHVRFQRPVVLYYLLFGSILLAWMIRTGTPPRACPPTATYRSNNDRILPGILGKSRFRAAISRCRFFNCRVWHELTGRNGWWGSGILELGLRLS